MTTLSKKQRGRIRVITFLAAGLGVTTFACIGSLFQPMSVLPLLAFAGWLLRLAHLAGAPEDASRIEVPLLPSKSGIARATKRLNRQSAPVSAMMRVTDEWTGAVGSTKESIERISETAPKN